MRRVQARRVADRSTRTTTTGAAGRRSRRIRFVVVPEVASRINGLLSRPVPLRLRHPAGPDRRTSRRTRRSRCRAAPILNHRLTVFDKNHPQLADPLVRRAFTHAIDRQAIVDSLWAGRTRVPPGLQWEFYGDDVHRRLDGAGLRSEAGAGAAEGRPTTRAIRSPIACSTTTTPTRSRRRRCWSRCGAPVGLNVADRDARRTGSRSSSAHRPARGARLVELSAAFNDPVSLARRPARPEGQQQQIGEWTNDEMNKLSEFLETSTDMAARKTTFRRMLEICEREDPAYTVLHQNATFTAKRKASSGRPRRPSRWISAPAISRPESRWPPLVSIAGPHRRLRHGVPVLRAVDGIDLECGTGEALGLVGESGSRQVGDLACGARPAAAARARVGGSVRLDGRGISRRAAPPSSSACAAGASP